MKVSRVLAMMLCIMIMANCLVVAAAASGSENVSDGLHKGVCLMWGGRKSNCLSQRAESCDPLFLSKNFKIGVDN